MNLCSRSEKQYPSGTDLVSRLFFVTLLISRKFLTSSKLHRKSVIEIAFFGVLEFSNHRGFCCSTFHIIGFTVLALIDVWESIFLVVSLCSWYFCLHFNDGFWKGQVFISQKTCKITCPKPCKAEGKGKKVYKKWNKKVTKLTTVHLSQSWSRILLHFSSVVVFKKIPFSRPYVKSSCLSTCEEITKEVICFCDAIISETKYFVSNGTQKLHKILARRCWNYIS